VTHPPVTEDFAAVRTHPLLYALADFAWAHNHSYLDDEIKRISFQNIRNPTMNTVSSMHALREDLDFLRAEVGQTLRHAPSTLIHYYEQPTSGDVTLLGTNEIPLEALRHTANDADVLDGFLTNSLNLLIASIALRDSQRAEMLTWLAAVYVPLSFVTGIFGMNLRELNESTLPVWICLEVLGVVLLVTLVLVMGYKWWEKHRDLVSRRLRRGPETGDDFDEP
jgi:Mg2+ and Co2+ transporter CorA